MKRTMFYLLLLAGTLLLAGCQKTGLFSSDDSLIRFTASARPETKTEYGAEETSDGKVVWQSIDWVNGDKIRIYSDKAVDRYNPNQKYADYIVINRKQGTSRSKLSTANLSNATAASLADATGQTLPDPTNDPGIPNPSEKDDVSGLVWGAVDYYTFYASYPAVASPNGASGKLSGSISATQTFDATTLVSDMKSNAYMTAAAKVKTEEVGKGVPVTLNFDPAFTAFEISLKSDTADPIAVTAFELKAADNHPAIAGAFTVEYGTDLVASYNCTGTGKSVSVEFPANTTVTNAADGGLTFTIFALPQALTGLTLSFTILTDPDDPTSETTRSLDLTYAKAVTVDGHSYSAGDFVPFAARKQHRIYGLIMPGSVFNFKYIDVTGQAVEWTAIPVNTDNKDYPEATQFEVEGVNNGRYNTNATQTEPVAGRDADGFRQYWLLDKDHPATVKFKVMSPVGYDWLVVPEGDVDAYTITSNVNDTGYTAGGLRGPIKTVIGSATTTNVFLYISAKNSTDTQQHTLHFKTYVISRDDKVKYSIDSETQLFDFRGYHYFILNNSTIVN